MAVIKNQKTGMWEVRTYYKDWTGTRRQKTKRGFAKKSEAQEWERAFKLKDEMNIKGNMGSEEHKEMLFWTKEEYKKFADEMMDKPVSFYAFEMLYWCGIREGELLALTAADFNFDKETVTINKSYQRLHGEDVITSPKTKKSNRTIKMPKFLCEEMQEYISMLYGLKKKDRIFTVTKS